MEAKPLFLAEDVAWLSKAGSRLAESSDVNGACLAEAESQAAAKSDATSESGDAQGAEPVAMRMWSPEDYPMLKSWWEGHGWRPVPQAMLPPLGVIWRDCAAGWVYMDNGGSGVAMMEWFVTDPASGLRGAKGLTHVVAFLLEELRA